MPLHIDSSHDAACAPRNHADRRASIAKRRRALEEEKQLERQKIELLLRDHDQKYMDALATIDVAAAAREEQLGRELVDASSKALAPLIAAWMYEPTRQCATKINDVLEAMLAREQNDCPAGNCLSRPVRLVAYTICDVLLEQYPDAVGSFQTGQPNGMVEALGAVSKAIGSPPQLEVALAALEGVLVKVAAAALPRQEISSHEAERCHGRWKLVRQCAPNHRLEAFDKEADRIKNRAFAAEYRAPGSAEIIQRAFG
jgi:hypothetical protein